MQLWILILTIAGVAAASDSMDNGTCSGSPASPQRGNVQLQAQKRAQLKTEQNRSISVDPNECSCKETDPDCYCAVHSEITGRATCKTRPRYTSCHVHQPAILFADVGGTCPFDEYGVTHQQLCADCRRLHKPCASQFVACDGCCSSSGDVPSVHKCESIKDYFKTANTVCRVELDEDDGTPANPDSVDIIYHKHECSEQVFHEYAFEAKCTLKVQEIKCKQVPAVLEFDCEPCNVGSPQLLKKCCDSCVQFANSPMGKMKNIRPFMHCKGCDVTTLVIDGETHAWKYAGQYEGYTTPAANRMDPWIENEICPLLHKSSACSSQKIDTSSEMVECSDGISAPNGEKIEKVTKDDVADGISAPNGSNIENATKDDVAKNISASNDSNGSKIENVTKDDVAAVRLSLVPAVLAVSLLAFR